MISIAIKKSRVFFGEKKTKAGSGVPGQLGLVAPGSFLVVRQDWRMFEEVGIDLVGDAGGDSGVGIRVRPSWPGWALGLRRGAGWRVEPPT